MAWQRVCYQMQQLYQNRVWAFQKELFVAKSLLEGVGRDEALVIRGLLW